MTSNKNFLFIVLVTAAIGMIMLTSQSASANMIGGFDCFGESECVSGWNDALSQAQTDWNSGQYTQIQNGGNPDCFTGHTQAYCNGYTKGYTYEWNTLYQSSQPTPSPSQPTPTQCPLGETIGNDGSCHPSLKGIINACLNHPTACSILRHFLGLPI
jgi:hypothetical protein